MKNKHRIAVAGLSALFLAATVGSPNLKLKTELPPVPTVAIPGSNPGVCVGFNPERNSFGQEYLACPKGYSYQSVDDPAGKSGPAEHIGAASTCCPLPYADVLTEEHVFAEVSCPEEYIATGAKGWESGPDGTKFMRCTKINTARYQLGPMTPGKYWGNGFAGWQGSDRVDWSEIPAGLRYSVGREAANKWDADGCVGYPWGSLLAKKTSKYCGGMYFRQLQFKGQGGDPKEGTAVKMFADCDEVTNVDDPSKVNCIKHG